MINKYVLSFHDKNRTLTMSDSTFAEAIKEMNNIVIWVWVFRNEIIFLVFRTCPVSFVKNFSALKGNFEKLKKMDLKPDVIDNTLIKNILLNKSGNFRTIVGNYLLSSTAAVPSEEMTDSQTFKDRGKVSDFTHFV